MDLDDEQQRLVQIERDLRRDDPALERRFAVFSATPAQPPSWRALGATALLLVAAGVLLAASAHWHNPVLLVAAIVVFSVAGLPVGSGRWRRRTDRGPRRDTDAGADS